MKFHEQFASIRTAPFKPTGKTMKWQLVVDVGSVELFVGDNTIVFSNLFYPTSPFNSIEVFSTDGIVTMNDASITELKPTTPKE